MTWADGRPEALAVNPYDPQFRGASDLYNQSLEGCLRLVQQEGELRPGMTRTVTTANTTCSFDVTMHSTGWHADDIDRLGIRQRLQIQGLQNHYHTYGLGVPLIAVRRTPRWPRPGRALLPAECLLSAHGILAGRKRRRQIRRDRTRLRSRNRRQTQRRAIADPTAPHFVLELYDPLDQQSIEVANRGVPLEADLSTPLAYFLNQPQFRDRDISTIGLLHPGEVKKLQGLYMLEPFDPHKMPVVMVHGLWSSPITWMEMYNDLRSDPQVRENYQFWFYLYPTGQPFWISATQMREDLAMMRREVDPARQDPALDEMVLVGHSMGGLVAKLQTVESCRRLLAHDERSLHSPNSRPIPDTVRALATTFYLPPEPIGATRRHAGYAPPRQPVFQRHHALGRRTSSSHCLTKCLRATINCWLKTHTSSERTPRSILRRASIRCRPIRRCCRRCWPLRPVRGFPTTTSIGREPNPGWASKYIVGEGDGVVALTSARLDDTPDSNRKSSFRPTTATFTAIRKVCWKFAAFCSSNWPNCKTSLRTTVNKLPNGSSWQRLPQRSSEIRTKLASTFFERTVLHEPTQLKPPNFSDAWLG